jgi:UPF0716 protein FxsA
MPPPRRPTPPNPRGPPRPRPDARSALLKLALLFTALPLVELYLLIQIGKVIGALPTIALVLFTGVLGAYLARMEGLRTLLRAQENLRSGVVPAEELVDALLIFVAGAMLITPGVLTDVTGFLILFPPTRRYFKIWLRRRFDRAVALGDVRIYRGPGPGSGPGQGPGGLGPFGPL